MEIQLLKTDEHCLIPGCKRCLVDGSRGLCKNHRVMAGAKVRAGKTTWEELEAKGLARRKFTKEEYAGRRRHPKSLRRYIPGITHSIRNL